MYNVNIVSMKKRRYYGNKRIEVQRLMHTAQLLAAQYTVEVVFATVARLASLLIQ